MRNLLSINIKLLSGLFVLIAIVLINKNSLAEDWHQWLGPYRNGITMESSGWQDKWQPQKIWTKNVGKGCTSPIIVKGKIYVMGWQGDGNLNNNPIGTDTLYCFDAKTGNELWKQTYPCRYQARKRIGDENEYGGPSSTPVFDYETNYIYTLSIDGDLRCWDTSKDGQLVWSLNLYDKYDIPQRPDVGRGKRDYGFTSSPLIHDNLVIIEAGDDEGTVMAFDKKSGKQRWKSECNEFAGHSSGPTTLTIDKVKCLVTLTLKKLVIMRMDKGYEGKTIAEYHWQSDYGNNIPTPAVVNNKILITSSWNNNRTALIEVSLDGISEKWKAKDFSQVSSPIIYKDFIYMVNGALFCLDLNSGQRKWKGGSFGNGSCILTGDNKLIVFGEGQLALVEAFSDGYRELGRIENIVPDISYPHVALSDGMIVCKDKSGNMVCFSVQ